MATSALRPGDPLRLGSYAILGRLGAGGQGVVYLGETEQGERVAIKVFHYDVDEAFLIRELAMMRQVASFCTARVLDAQVTGNTWYIVSEYIDGRSLADVVDNDGPLAGGALERLAVGTVTALTAIHRTGVIHRDFKPANILLGPDGPRVIDFGIARTLDLTTTAGEIRGTPAYMAPEQINGQTTKPAADMFAWAATMSFAATGRSPFGSDTLPAIIMRVLQEQPDLDELPGTLREVALACLAKDPAARPTAQDVLIRLLGDSPSAPARAAGEVTELAAGFNLAAAGARTAAASDPPPVPASSTPAPPTQQAPTPPSPPRQPYPPPVGYPPAAQPPAAWVGGGPPSPRPQPRSDRLTRVVIPIAAVVIVAIGAIVGLALTGVFSGTKSASGPARTPAATGISQKPSPTKATHARTHPARTRTKPAPARSTPAPVQTSPAPVQSTPAPVQSTPPPVQTPPPGNGPVSTIPLDLGGRWSGIGHQPGDAQTPTYTIVMTLSGGGTGGSTSYSSLGCQGNLTLLPGSTANSVQLREQITSGGCTSSGVFTVHLRNGRLAFSYAPGGPGPASYGTLHS